MNFVFHNFRTWGFQLAYFILRGYMRLWINWFELVSLCLEAVIAYIVCFLEVLYTYLVHGLLIHLVRWLCYSSLCWFIGLVVEASSSYVCWAFIWKHKATHFSFWQVSVKLCILSLWETYLVSVWSLLLAFSYVMTQNGS